MLLSYSGSYISCNCKWPKWWPFGNPVYYYYFYVCAPPPCTQNNSTSSTFYRTITLPLNYIVLLNNLIQSVTGWVSENRVRQTNNLIENSQLTSARARLRPSVRPSVCLYLLYIRLFIYMRYLLISFCNSDPAPRASSWRQPKLVTLDLFRTNGGGRSCRILFATFIMARSKKVLLCPVRFKKFLFLFIPVDEDFDTRKWKC